MQQKQPTFSISGERESGQDVRTQNGKKKKILKKKFFKINIIKIL